MALTRVKEMVAALNKEFGKKHGFTTKEMNAHGATYGLTCRDVQAVFFGKARAVGRGLYPAIITDELPTPVAKKAPAAKKAATKVAKKETPAAKKTTVKKAATKKPAAKAPEAAPAAKKAAAKKTAGKKLTPAQLAKAGDHSHGQVEPNVFILDPADIDKDVPHDTDYPVA